MTTLTPVQSATLAQEVYAVQDDVLLSVFLKRPEFSGAGRAQAILKAELGSRLLKVQDLFAVCSAGQGVYSQDLFLVFRGSTTANYMADWVSNARIGLERGRTGSLVHIGFNHIFNSVLPELKVFLDRHAHISGTMHWP